ncbi:MAG: DUF2069 domain-containing protein [Cocleimonas sp.]
MDITIFWRILAGFGIAGLVILSVAWNGWLSPDQVFPRSIEIALLVVPLLFFVRGVFKGNRNTFIAVMLLSFVYMLLGIWYAYSGSESLYGWIMLGLSLCLFFGSLLNVWILDKRDKESREK